MPHKHTIFNPTQLIQASRNGTVEVRAPLEDCTREQLRADILRIQAWLVEQAATLSSVDFFSVYHALKYSLELARQQWYAKHDQGDLSK